MRDRAKANASAKARVKARAKAREKETVSFYNHPTDGQKLSDASLAFFSRDEATLHVTLSVGRSVS